MESCMIKQKVPSLLTGTYGFIFVLTYLQNKRGKRSSERQAEGEHI